MEDTRRKKNIFDVLVILSGFALSVFLHEFGHLIAASFFGDRPYLVIGEGFFGPALLIYVGLDYGFEYWVAAISGPLFSGLILAVLSYPYQLWGLKPAAIFQFLYTAFEVTYILFMMGIVGEFTILVIVVMNNLLFAYLLTALLARRMN